MLEKSYRRVYAKLCSWMLWHLKCIGMIAAVYVSSADLLSIHYKQEFSMVGGNMEDLKNNGTVKIVPSLKMLLEGFLTPTPTPRPLQFT